MIYIVATSYAHHRYHFIDPSALLLSGNQQRDIHEHKRPAASATLRPERDESAAPCIAITVKKDVSINTVSKSQLIVITTTPSLFY
jgi:hypothetical protein